MWFHAYMMKPDVSTVVQSLQREYCELREVEKALGEGSPVKWGGAVGPSNMRNLRGKFRVQAEDMLHQSAQRRRLDQFLSCLYFQKQQQAYVANDHNRRNPDDPVVIDANGQWEESAHSSAPPASDSDLEDDAEHAHGPSGNLSEYELERLRRIREHSAFLQQLDLSSASNK